MFIGIVLAVLSTAYAQQNVTICEGVPVNTFIRDVSRCDGWVRCSAAGPAFGEKKLNINHSNVNHTYRSKQRVE